MIIKSSIISCTTKDRTIYIISSFSKEVLIIVKLAVCQCTPILNILTIFQGWYSLLDNAPNYLVGCVIQKRSRNCTYVSSELPSSVKMCFIWPLIQPMAFSWYVTSLSNWHWEPKFPAWHWLTLPEQFQIKI